MAGKTVLALSLLAIVLPTILAQQCKPGDNCKPPNCRCWNDAKAPGGFDTRDIPQMIVVSFEYGVNRFLYEYYDNLLKGIVNPNKCPVHASFYVTKQHTDFTLAALLFKQGHELAVSAISDVSPGSAMEWAGNFSAVKTQLKRAGIPEERILGSRAPNMYFGGNEQISAAKSNGLAYDTSCGTVRFDSGNFLWPYTYDFVQGAPNCTTGLPVTKPFPGIWQFMVADLEFKGRKCATPSSCAPLIKSPKDASDFFYNAFSQHYNQETRPPFNLVIDPVWLLDSNRAEGTKQFLELVGAAFGDVWIVTAEQALAWMRNPVKASEAHKFKPWSC